MLAVKSISNKSSHCKFSGFITTTKNIYIKTIQQLFRTNFVRTQQSCNIPNRYIHFSIQTMLFSVKDVKDLLHI